jgi:hypothetical protein
VALVIDDESKGGVHKLADEGIAVAVMGKYSQKSLDLARS